MGAAGKGGAATEAADLEASSTATAPLEQLPWEQQIWEQQQWGSRPWKSDLEELQNYAILHLFFLLIYILKHPFIDYQYRTAVSSYTSNYQFILF
jgi:hypothetical protein